MIFSYIIINKICSYKCQQIPIRGREKRVNYWSSQTRSFSEANPLKYLWKCKSVNEIFPLLICSVGKKRRMVRGMHRSPCSGLFEVARERLYISFELTGIWNVIDRFPNLNHYLLFDYNVSLFLLLQYCLHFTFVKRALIEPCKVFLSFCRINEDVFTGPRHSVHSTIMDFSLCWLKALFLCYLSILYLLLDCNIKGYLAKHWNNNCISLAEVVTWVKYMPPLARQVTTWKKVRLYLPVRLETIWWLYSPNILFFSS